MDRWDIFEDKIVQPSSHISVMLARKKARALAKRREREKIRESAERKRMKQEEEHMKAVLRAQKLALEQEYC